MIEPIDLNKYREQTEATKRQLEELKIGTDSTGGGGGMDGRIEKLEREMADIKAVLSRLEPTLKSVNDDVKEIKGRVGAMPTTWQLIGLVIGIFGLAFAILRFTGK